MVVEVVVVEIHLNPMVFLVVVLVVLVMGVIFLLFLSFIRMIYPVMSQNNCHYTLKDYSLT